MDWFEKLTGFAEDGYESTRNRLEVSGRALRSKVNGRRFGVGEFEMPSLGELRVRAERSAKVDGRVRVRTVSGDVRALHQAPEYAGALFQVASQFNCLEMASPDVTPCEGVARYASDPTQGPACAQAAGAATLYRNYFVPVGNQIGQTAERQLDGLADLGDALSLQLGRPRGSLWTMRNGYALCSREGLDAIAGRLETADEPALDQLRSLLRIGVQWDVEATEGPVSPGPLVCQAFCSALPVAYTTLPRADWRAFATLVLEAAYEATLLAAVVNAGRGASRTVLLTRLGGGAFGNDDRWIDAALTRALRRVEDAGLDVHLVSYGPVPPSMRALASAFSE